MTVSILEKNFLNDGSGALKRSFFKGDFNHCRELIDAGVNANNLKSEIDKMFGSVNSGELAKEYKSYVDIFSQPISYSQESSGYPKNFDPLHKAISNNLTKIADQLIKMGVNVNIKDNSGDTPLHLAAQNGDTDLVSKLTMKGADVNAKNNVGDTPLHLAASKNFLSITNLLISNGADKNLQNDKNQTPIDVASERCRHLMGVSFTRGSDDKTTVSNISSRRTNIDPSESVGRMVSTAKEANNRQPPINLTQQPRGRSSEIVSSKNKIPESQKYQSPNNSLNQKNKGPELK